MEETQPIWHRGETKFDEQNHSDIGKNPPAVSADVQKKAERLLGIIRRLRDSLSNVSDSEPSDRG